MKKKETDALAAFDSGLKSDQDLAYQQMIKDKEESKEREKFVAKFLDGQPFDETRLWNEYEFFYENSAAAFIEAGKRLVVLKHMVGHGEFMKALEERGINDRTARMQMAVAIRFANRSTSAVLGKSKLFLLTQLSEEETDTLNEQGTALGKSMDELESMSVKELRELVRKSKAKIEKKNEENEKLRRENERLADRASERDKAKEIGKMDINVDYLRLADAFNAFIKTLHNTSEEEIEKSKFIFGRALTAFFNDSMEIMGVHTETTVHVAGRNFRPLTDVEKADEEYKELEKKL
jgi:regulator of replication initiation timing